MFPIKDSNTDFDNWIDTLDFKNISVLEFGSGQSTLWWQQR